MKILKYSLEGNAVEMTWNETNEEIAALEADGGVYTIEENDNPELVIEPSTEELLNALLGVTE